MIIITTNEALAALLTSYSQHDGNDGYTLYPLNAHYFTKLADVLTTKYAGQWKVYFGWHPTASYEGLTVGVDGANWQAFMLAPGKYGADTDDLISFIENIYCLSVTNENHKQVAQMFRLWFAYKHPEKYTNPATQRRDRVKKAQSSRRNRLTQAANRLNCATIDKLAVAVLALSDEDAATLRTCFEDVTQKT